MTAHATTASQELSRNVGLCFAMPLTLLTLSIPLSVSLAWRHTGPRMEGHEVDRALRNVRDISNRIRQYMRPSSMVLQCSTMFDVARPGSTCLGFVD